MREGVVREGSLKVIMGLSFQRVNGGLLGQQLISQLALQENLLGGGPHSWHFICFNSFTPQNSLWGKCFYCLHFLNEEAEAQNNSPTHTGCGFNHHASWPLWKDREDIPDTEVRTALSLIRGTITRGSRDPSSYGADTVLFSPWSTSP